MAAVEAMRVTVTILQGHCLDVLAGMEAQSVHCCVTSPPFWKLRAYGTAPQTWPGGWVGELGQEPTPEAFVSHLVDVFRAVKRVLRDDGVAFVNLGDSYWSDPGGQNGTTGNVSARAITANAQAGRQDRTRYKHERLKSGDLCMAPSLFALAMQADGWVLRSAITWIKTSPMPESLAGTAWVRCKVRAAGQPDRSPRGTKAVESGHRDGGPGGHLTTAGTAEWADCPGCPRCQENEGLVLRRGSGRPTSAYELLFMFSKNMGGYFWDQESVRVQAAPDTIRRAANAVGGSKFDASRGDGGPDGLASRRIGDFAGGRNPYNWMTFKPAPSSLEHYAGYPPELPLFCIKAGTSERGVCPTCGAPWARVISRTPGRDGSEDGRRRVAATGGAISGGFAHSTLGTPGGGNDTGSTTTLGWRPTCPPGCHQGLPPVPAVCLDPFFGSGTTGMVADRLGRDCVGIDLKSEYVSMSERRIVGDAPLFAQVSVEGAAAG